MQRMRDVLKQNLGRTLEALEPLDRLQTAWPVACGRAMAAQGRVTSYAEGVVTLHVADPVWREQIFTMREMLMRELARISGLTISAIHFEQRQRTR